ncbi:hypothetical protein [Salinibacterium sp. ZJ454]|uniref:hypothetical protein n=1 Tax=Salinibacterium sp. ZJ454 TaxID=2708339 RepID=UPI00141E6E1B|nr:hypothetical protein [Salinibacterium sp. ZJ454]
MKPIEAVGTAVAAFVGVATGYCAARWARYGNPVRQPPDPVLDKVIPHPEVDEWHQIAIDAPAAIAFSVARDIDMWQSPPIRAILWLRAIPAMLGGEPFRMPKVRGLVAETEGLGWQMLDWDPGHRLVLGAYTQPWRRTVKFGSLPLDQFAAFNEPGYAKIAVTIQAEPTGPDSCLLVTRTRVGTTDAEARRRFRLYWGPISAGIVTIRYLALPMIKRRAEQRVADEASGRTDADTRSPVERAIAEGSAES